MVVLPIRQLVVGSASTGLHLITNFYMEVILMTKSLKPCRTCFGRKQFPGMGGMSMRDCATCHGIGYIPPVEEAGEVACEPAKPKRAYRKRAAKLDFGVEG